MLEARGRVKVHLSGIAGTAMASLAGLLRERGHEVTGSDQDIYPPMSTQLEELGIPVRSPYAEANVPADADLVVIGNALSRGNPEVEVVLDRKQRMTSLPALARRGVHARAHARWWWRARTARPRPPACSPSCSTEAGLDPSFLIGGVPAGLRAQLPAGRGARTSWSKATSTTRAFFDKRPKFLHYLPDVAVIGNVEYDHADIYPDLASVQRAFVRLLHVIPRRGLLVAGWRARPSREILPRRRCRGGDVRPRRGGGLARGGRAGPAGRRLALPPAPARGKDLGEFALAAPGRAQRAQRARRARGRGRRRGVAPEEAREALAALPRA